MQLTCPRRAAPIKMPGNMPASISRPGKTLRIIGLLVLVFGLSGAGLVYWRGAPPGNLSGDLDTARTSKRMERAIEVNVGKMGVVMDGLAEDLHDPANQALLIAAASVLVSAGCFYFASLQARGAAMPNDASSP
jgi:hypothetical protein